MNKKWGEQYEVIVNSCNGKKLPIQFCRICRSVLGSGLSSTFFNVTLWKKGLKREMSKFADATQLDKLVTTSADRKTVQGPQETEWEDNMMKFKSTQIPETHAVKKGENYFKYSNMRTPSYTFIRNHVREILILILSVT